MTLNNLELTPITAKYATVCTGHKPSDSFIWGTCSFSTSDKIMSATDVQHARHKLGLCICFCIWLCICLCRLHICLSLLFMRLSVFFIGFLFIHHRLYWSSSVKRLSLKKRLTITVKIPKCPLGSSYMTIGHVTTTIITVSRLMMNLKDQTNLLIPRGLFPWNQTLVSVFMEASNNKLGQHGTEQEAKALLIYTYWSWFSIIM